MGWERILAADERVMNADKKTAGFLTRRSKGWFYQRVSALIGGEDAFGENFLFVGPLLKRGN